MISFGIQIIMRRRIGYLIGETLYAVKNNNYLDIMHLTYKYLNNNEDFQAAPLHCLGKKKQKQIGNI